MGTNEDFNNAFKEYKKQKNRDYYQAVELIIVSVILAGFVFGLKAFYGN